MTGDGADTGVWADTGDTAVWADTGDTGVWADTGDTTVWAETADTGVWADTGDTGVWADTGDAADFADAAVCAEASASAAICSTEVELWSAARSPTTTDSLTGTIGCATATPAPMATTPSAPVIDQNVRDFFMLSNLSSIVLLVIFFQPDS